MSFIEAFKKLALERYDEGFDVFVEAYTDSELVEYFEFCNTLEEAVAFAQVDVDIRNERMGHFVCRQPVEVEEAAPENDNLLAVAGEFRTFAQERNINVFLRHLRVFLRLSHAGECFSEDDILFIFSHWRTAEPKPYAPLVIRTDEECQREKPVLVLPCSANKAKVTAAPACELYTGAYMSIMNKWSWAKITGAFNVFFLSAKYGLVKHDEVLDNYEQKLDLSRLNEFSCDNSLKHRAKELLRATSRQAEAFIMLPKMYAKGLDLLCGDELKLRAHKETFKPGSGIGSQRGQINELLLRQLGQPLSRIHKFSI